MNSTRAIEDIKEELKYRIDVLQDEALLAEVQALLNPPAEQISEEEKRELDEILDNEADEPGIPWEEAWERLTHERNKRLGLK